MFYYNMPRVASKTTWLMPTGTRFSIYGYTRTFPTLLLMFEEIFNFSYCKLNFLELLWKCFGTNIFLDTYMQFCCNWLLSAVIFLLLWMAVRYFSKRFAIVFLFYFAIILISFFQSLVNFKWKIFAVQTIFLFSYAFVLSISHCSDLFDLFNTAVIIPWLLLLLP